MSRKTKAIAKAIAWAMQHEFEKGSGGAEVFAEHVSEHLYSNDPLWTKRFYMMLLAYYYDKELT